MITREEITKEVKSLCENFTTPEVLEFFIVDYIGKVQRLAYNEGVETTTNKFKMDTES